MGFMRITDLADLPEQLQGCVVAIGNFDGVHRGHQSVLIKALEKAEALGVPAIVLTFEPHPRSFFQPEKPVFRLSPAPVRAALLSAIGFEGVIEHPFDVEFSGTSAADFVQGTLLDTLNAKHVITGYDFHFGKGREGGPDYLKKASEQLGFGLSLVEAFHDEGSQVVSSSRIREFLEQGEIAQANGLLGYAYQVRGTVVKGKQLGRDLGYPTANLELPAETKLRHGIYAVRARLEDGSLHDGVASYGRRPTFDNGEALLETFVFDFSGDLYGQEIDVHLYGWIRGEEKFDSVEALIQQMDKDSQEARAILGAFGPEQGTKPILNG